MAIASPRHRPEVHQAHRLDSCERGFGARVVRADETLEPCAARALRDGEHAADPPQPPVERELAAGRVLGQPVPRNLSRGGEKRQGR